MPPGAGMFYLLGVLLIELPVALLRSVLRLVGWIWRCRRRWRAVDIQTKSHIRLRSAVFALAVLLGASLFRVIPYDNPAEIWGALAVAGYALLNLGAGLFGVLFAERCRFDPLSIFWWSVGAASCVALLVYSGMAGW